MKAWGVQGFPVCPGLVKFSIIFDEVNILTFYKPQDLVEEHFCTKNHLLNDQFVIYSALYCMPIVKSDTVLCNCEIAITYLVKNDKNTFKIIIISWAARKGKWCYEGAWGDDLIVFHSNLMTCSYVFALWIYERLSVYDWRTDHQIQQTHSGYSRPLGILVLNWFQKASRNK